MGILEAIDKNEKRDNTEDRDDVEGCGVARGERVTKVQLR